VLDESMKKLLAATFVALLMVGCGEEPGGDSPESNASSAEIPPDKTAEDDKIKMGGCASTSTSWVSDPSDPNSVKIEKAIREWIEWPVGEITKEDLEQIKGLRLDDNQLTDVKSLEKLTQLRTVNLSGNQLTSVKGLEKLTQLTYLALYNNPALTKAQIDQLQKALPKCEINRIGMPEPTLVPPRESP